MMHGAPAWLFRPRARRFARVLVEDAYLTDGVRLFRCDQRDEGTAVLEDCRTLQLIFCTVTELAQAELRFVRPSPCAPLSGRVDAQAASAPAVASGLSR